jgi:N-hydroxyarylamine O-acetyltransferase
MQDYFQRLALSTPPTVSAAGLHTLVRAQGHAIAFENFDVLAGVPVRVDAPAIVEKIIGQGRGGYCYELNDLLAHVLRETGFSVEPKLARVTYRRPGPGPRSHLVLFVRVDGDDWLVDAGFGGPGLTAPVILRAGAEFVQSGASFRLTAGPAGQLQLERKIGGVWEGPYLISPEEVLPIDVESANHFTSTWHGSPFRSKLMCVRPGDEESVVIRGPKLVRLDPELRPTFERRLADHEEFTAVCADVFGLRIPAGLARQVWAFAVAAGPV